jgi:imidazolonepropionase-like amidohydrolase
MFTEMRLLAEHDPAISPAQMLQMVTVNGARALGLAGQIGQLARNTAADWIALPFAGKTASVFDAVIQHPGRIQAGMIAGQWTVPLP